MKEKKNRKQKSVKICLLAAAALILFGIPACGASSGSSDSASTNEMSGAQADGIYEEIAEADTGAEPVEVEENAASDRKLIKNVTMTVETEDYSGLVSSVQNRVEELGGYTERYDAYNENSIGSRSAYMTLRIPADRLDEFIRQVEEISNIVSRQETVEDVTLSYVDLESRKRMYEEEEDRLLSLMEQAETLDEIIALESRLTEVRYQLESMESQLRTMDDQVSYSTVYLSIDEVEHYTPPAEKGTWERIRVGFTENVYRVGNGIREFFIGFVISLPILFVLAVIIAVAVVVIRLLLRVSEKNYAKRAAQGKGVRPVYGPSSGASRPGTGQLGNRPCGNHGGAAPGPVPPRQGQAGSQPGQAPQQGQVPPLSGKNNTDKE
ncbi:MAG TPA: DUF4349 domain-containing protein [Candidatus Eisenbergiella merdipullorum]|uniref:DUF4349 domain-containing protein n=1 Tax=Candidatus Eisenbergiella merdipullorum TaxID=2838553 RepID=A0A9D2I580_9FIRM|nr:DUF4349 domain-containing protein [Candidatus Eisenbergiella merdipullorum]